MSTIITVIITTATKAITCALAMPLFAHHFRHLSSLLQSQYLDRLVNKHCRVRRTDDDHSLSSASPLFVAAQQVRVLSLAGAGDPAPLASTQMAHKSLTATQNTGSTYQCTESCAKLTSFLAQGHINCVRVLDHFARLKLNDRKYEPIVVSLCAYGTDTSTRMCLYPSI